MPKIEYEENKFVIFDTDPTQGRLIDVDFTNKELADLSNQIEELRAVFMDDKKLLLWAKDEYEVCSGLTELLSRKRILLLDKSEAEA